MDTIKAGHPDTPVQGIATTVMATLDLLQGAAARGKNLIITHEPTFYNHEDKTQDFERNSVYLAKQEFIAKNKMIVFRFHDNWHAHQPDLVLTGLAQQLGFTRLADAANPHLFAVPTTTLDRLARDIQARLKSRTLRVLGKLEAKISRVALNPGYANLMGPVRALANADLFIAGEAREWEGVEYGRVRQMASGVSPRRAHRVHSGWRAILEAVEWWKMPSTDLGAFDRFVIRNSWRRHAILSFGSFVAAAAQLDDVCQEQQEFNPLHH